MSKLEALTGSPYLSFSSMESWLTCGERYRLEKVVGVKQGQAWYLLGGSAVHKATEMLDTQVTDNPDEAWRTAWDEQLATVDNEAKVRAGGRASKAWPNKEDRSWWEANGPDMVRAWHLHMTGLLAGGWVLLGVETPFNIDLSGVLIRGFVDRVMANPNGEVEAHDIKSGSHIPASTLQLGVYAHGIEQALGVRPTLGRYYMARTATLTDPSSLLHYTADLLAEWFGKARDAIEAEIFVPHVTAMCMSCGVREHCVAVGGTKPTFL